MSFDLTIVTQQKPEWAHVQEYFARLTGYGVSGELGAGAGYVLISHNTKSASDPCFTIDGPMLAEEEDLDEETAAVVSAPCWLLQLSVPAGAYQDSAGEALRFAQHLADACQGAVFDPQEGKVVWPVQRRRKVEVQHVDQRIRAVTLHWFFPASRPSCLTASSLLALLRRRCPEGVPTRFGLTEPYQHKLERDGDEAFLSFWDKKYSVESGGSLGWKSTWPCLGGYLSFPDWRDCFRPARAGRAVKLLLYFDGRRLHEDPQYCDTVVTLFSEIAQAYSAFYALGYVQRDVIFKRGQMWLDGKSEEGLRLRGRWWLGLDPTPTWLVWFGGWYARRLMKRLAGIATSRTRDSLVLRLGQEPMDRDQLAGVFPPLPQNLVIRETGILGPNLPARTLPHQL